MDIQNKWISEINNEMGTKIIRKVKKLTKQKWIKLTNQKKKKNSENRS